MPATEQKNIDHKMLEIDGTEFKKNLGANAMLAVSMAAASRHYQKVRPFTHT